MLRKGGWSCVEERMVMCCGGRMDGHVLRREDGHVVEGGWSCVDVVMC